MSRIRRPQLLGGLVSAVLGALFLLAAADSAQAQMKPGTAAITRVSGRVEILIKGQPRWVPAVVGAKLAEGDEIRSFSGGWAELVLPDASSLLVAENSRVAVTKLAIDHQNRTRLVIFHLAVGKVRAAVAQAAVMLVRARQSNFVITTPTGVAAARGSAHPVWDHSYNPATGQMRVLGISGHTLVAGFTIGDPVVVGAGLATSQVGTGRAAVPTPATLAEAAVPATANPATAGQPALVVPAPPPPTPQVLAVTVAAAVKVAPAEAAAVTAGIVAAAPEAAAQLTAAAVTAAPAQAAAIQAAAIAVAPAEAAAITAAVTTAAAAVTVAVPAVVVVVAPPVVPAPTATLGRDVQVKAATQACASPPCP